VGLTNTNLYFSFWITEGTDLEKGFYGEITKTFLAPFKKSSSFIVDGSWKTANTIHKPLFLLSAFTTCHAELVSASPTKPLKSLLAFWE
jgi:hypothetical protein